MADNDMIVYEGLEDRLEKINKLTPGSEEELRAMKAFEIQYNLALKETEMGYKIEDMEKKRAFEKEKADQESMDRQIIAESEAKSRKWQTGLSALALGVSGLMAIIGFVVDSPKSEVIRNNNRSRDIKDIFNLGEKLNKR